jgi:hypothetical protein
MIKRHDLLNKTNLQIVFYCVLICLFIITQNTKLWNQNLLQKG